MAQHNLNNIIVDRVLRGIFSDKNDNIIFSLNQIQDLSINSTSESQDIVDALGVSIMELMRSKAIEVSANNAIFDLGLMATQYGTEKVAATATDKLTVPFMETFAVEGTTHKLKFAPVGEVTAIYALNGDSTLGEKYTVSADAADDKTFNITGQDITLPTNLAEGTEMFVMYEYESENAVEVINSANKFPQMGKMTFEVLAYDVCDPETKMLAYVILPRFQLSGDMDWSIGGDNQQHPFSGKAKVDYCDKDKQMVRIVVVDDEE